MSLVMTTQLPLLTLNRCSPANPRFYAGGIILILIGILNLTVCEACNVVCLFVRLYISLPLYTHTGGVSVEETPATVHTSIHPEAEPIPAASGLWISCPGPSDVSCPSDGC